MSSELASARELSYASFLPASLMRKASLAGKFLCVSTQEPITHANSLQSVPVWRKRTNGSARDTVRAREGGSSCIYKPFLCFGERQGRMLLQSYTGGRKWRGNESNLALGPSEGPGSVLFRATQFPGCGERRLRNTECGNLYSTFHTTLIFR